MSSKMMVVFCKLLCVFSGIQVARTVEEFLSFKMMILSCQFLCVFSGIRFTRRWRSS